MEQYKVTGMSCAACSSRVEKAVSEVKGVQNCSVSLLTNSMGVEGTASAEAIIKAVEAAGYGASVMLENNNDNTSKQYENMLVDNETSVITKRLIASLIFLIPLVYVSMGHTMWGWPVLKFMEGNCLAIGIYELILSGIVMVINQKFFVSGFKGLLHRAPNMDTLVALGSSASFIYSVYALFLMTVASMNSDTELLMQMMHEFYFESAAMILTLITVGKMLESRSKGKTTDALKSLMKMVPRTAVVIKDNKEQIVSIENVRVGDRFVVKSGDSVSVDGIIVEGSGTIDESTLTGESIPVDKVIGDNVSAATINLNGYMVCEATRVGKDTTFSQIIKMVSDAAATKAPIAKVADKVSGVFVPFVMVIAIITFTVWITTGHDFGYSLARAISVLVISCPCALGLATPVAIMVGSGIAAKNGILFKTAESLEETGKAQIVVLDKTGTITEGKPYVTKIVTADKVTEEKLLSISYSLEKMSEHPLAKAIVEYGNTHSAEAIEISNFKVNSGNGLSGYNEKNYLIGGKLEFVKKYAKIPDDIQAMSDELSDNGMTPLYFAENSKLLGMIAVADVIKEDSKEAISQLKNMGLHVVMLTGDNEKTANAIGSEVCVDEVVAEVLPSEKDDVIKRLKEKGKVIMIGDGINDAVALTSSDIGIAIGAGTDVAIDAANIVLMKNRLIDAVAAIRISKATLKNIYENLFWAFFYNIIGIPLAAGIWIPVFGWKLNPMFGALAMSLSSFCVVSNALRLNLFKMYNSSNDKIIRNSLGECTLLDDYKKDKMEDTKMEITVNGMMCGHCEAHVVKAIEGLDGVVSVTADHNTNTVSIETNASVDESAIKAAVEEAGYEYAGLK